MKPSNTLKYNINSQLSKNGGDPSKIDYGEVLKSGFWGAVTGATNMFKTEVCAGADWSIQTFLGMVGIFNKATKYLPWNFSNMTTQMELNRVDENINNVSNKIHQFFRDKAPYKTAFDAAEFVLDVAMIADGVNSIANIGKNLPGKFSVAKLSLEGMGVQIPVLCVDGATSIASLGEISSIAGAGGVIYKATSNSSGGSSNSNLDKFNSEIATNKQKGNFGKIKADDNLLNNQSIKDAGYDLKSVGRDAPSGLDDKIVKGIDGLYENTNANSNVKYVIDEAKFGSSQLGTTKDGLQMSDDWLAGTKTGNNRILKAVDGDKLLANKIIRELRKGNVERVLSKVNSNGNVTTYKLDAVGNIIGVWP